MFRHRNKEYTTEQMLLIEPCATPEFRAWIASQPRPNKMCGRDVPSSLNDLTFGELTALSTDGNNIAVALNCAAVVLGVTSRRRVLREPASTTAGFLNFVHAEIKRINQLFADINRKPNADEIAAGVESLQFGAFGVVDWYARRMGFRDHDDVMSVKWVRIYECMRIDTETREYERRLRDILAQKHNKHN